VAKAGADIAHQNRQHGLDLGQAHHEAAMDVSQHALDVHQAMNPPEPKEPAT
jgi:hypothetical protein